MCQEKLLLNQIITRKILQFGVRAAHSGYVRRNQYIMKIVLGLTVASAFAFLTASPAEAGAILYNWTASIPFEDSGTVTGAGQLTASSTSSTGWDGTYTGFLVSSITGTYDGSTITGLAAIDVIGGNDNLVNTSQNLLDGDGIAFDVSPSLAGYTEDGGSIVNLYFGGPGYTDDGPTDETGTFTLTAVTSGVSEPATASLVAVGILACIGLRRRLRA
jgi:hypothetical protein